MHNESKNKPNRLITEKSPYLLQHAHNPVDWYPWGDAAFEAARRADKPIFLSIGYSTCHWCHVMAHESFENPAVARLMNEAFISIKVDREERPDIDGVYMTICQMMTGSGGWPLTIIMTPDKKPFFAATYIPRETRFGRVGMLDLIPRIQEAWTARRAELLSSADQIVGVLQRTTRGAAGDELDETALDTAYTQLASRYDAARGGFGTAPKFPSPHNLLFLLRYWQRKGYARPLNMVEKTLHEMRRGGIYDHIGFGFHRYATDAEWLVPHFEKMLYDQALLALAYTEAYQATGAAEYARTAREILTYVLRDMTAPEGGFYSAEDADSEGEEGKFYVWTEAELRAVLDDAEADLVIKVFNVERGGNYMEEATGVKTSANILHLHKSWGQLAAELEIEVHELRARWEAARRKLFTHREGRVHPHKDDKILTDWNGLMIAALATAGRVFAEAEYTTAAERAANFVLNELRTADGRLLHRYRAGEAAIAAHADDYAFMIWALLELYETTFAVQYLRTALELNTDFIAYFWDNENGGFYATADDAEELLVRQKEIYDGAIPSGNSVAMLNLLRLGRITANAELEQRAAQLARAFSRQIMQTPSGYTFLMTALNFGLGDSYEVVIVGDSTAADTQELIRALRGVYVPNKVVILRPTEQGEPEIVNIAEFTRRQHSIDGKATAYVCVKYQCDMPTTDVDEMLQKLVDIERNYSAYAPRGFATLA